MWANLLTEFSVKKYSYFFDMKWFYPHFALKNHTLENKDIFNLYFFKRREQNKNRKKKVLFYPFFKSLYKSYFIKKYKEKLINNNPYY